MINIHKIWNILKNHVVNIKFNNKTPTCWSWSHGLRSKIFVSVAVTLAPVRVPSPHLPRVPRHSHLLTDIKGDNEIIPEAVHKSRGIYFTAEETPPPKKTSTRRYVDEGCAASHRPK